MKKCNIEHPTKSVIKEETKQEEDEKSEARESIYITTQEDEQEETYARNKTLKDRRSLTLLQPSDKTMTNDMFLYNEYNFFENEAQNKTSMVNEFYDQRPINNIFLETSKE